jgi:hypothetical protein
VGSISKIALGLPGLNQLFLSPSEVNPTKLWPNSFKAWLKTSEHKSSLRVIIIRVLNFLQFSGVDQLPIKTWHEAISKLIPFNRFPPEMNLWNFFCGNNP